MLRRLDLSLFLAANLYIALLASTVHAQTTLGGITGTVADKMGKALPGEEVTLLSDQTELARSQRSNENGNYTFVNLPIGTYTLTFTCPNFETQRVRSIRVQANRTATVDITLQVGKVSEVIDVQANPLVNAVEPTLSQVLESGQIQATPLPTGSFTGLAILSPGISAELPGGTGANSGLGNQPLWANGQRDTSNTFLLNGVDVSNLFNGKSTSQVASARLVTNIGVSGVASSSAAEVQSTASVYTAIGQAIPSPAPETIEEMRINTSMYNAQQGSTSGAHIDMSTSSGTNAPHSSVYVTRGTDWLNAAPFFFKQDPNIPANGKVPELHRLVAGGTVGGPLRKDKLFGFLAYQRLHDSDQEIGISRLAVPFGLSDRNRTAAGLAEIANDNFGTSITGSQVDPIALALFQYKLPNGQYLIPSANGNTPSFNFQENAVSPGTAYFSADQLVSNLDWNMTAKDNLALKYYYQHDPTIAPYAYSSVAGFGQNLDAGSQLISITNAQVVKPNLSVAEDFGFVREKVYSAIGQPFTPQQLGINAFGSSIFPGITIVDVLGNASPQNVNNVSNVPLNIGQGATSQGAFTGVFQNRLMPSANATWLLGKHTLNFGGSYSYTQLNVRDNKVNTGIISSANFAEFIQGLVDVNDNFSTTKFLQGNANRYYRANQVGAYLQDDFKPRSNVSLTGGIRFDWDGGLTEKYGRIYNFDPALYQYDEASDSIESNGFIIAGNNRQYPSHGVSNTTLTGRQWGIAPRLGAAWTPKRFDEKIVIRSGFGVYYDRGELYSYLSPGYAAGVVTGGPFGVNQAPPFVSAQSCSSTYLYEGFIPTCDPVAGYSLANPWGSTLGPAPTGNPADISQYLPNQAEIETGAPLFSFANYNRANKLPYTINWSLDVQWQPRRDAILEIGYIGNSGRHEVIPIPFNQPEIASPSHPVHGQEYTYGYTVLDNTGSPIELPNGQGPMASTYEGGNIDLRVPYIGYSAESESYTAAGISAYNALLLHFENRLQNGLQLAASYTWSHALDEQSAMGLFYNGNNPLNLRNAYGSSDFDRTHVLTFNFLYQLFHSDRTPSKRSIATRGWEIRGVGVVQSGQPYSVIDYSGAVGSIYYGVSNGITNPIVPLASGCTPKSAKTGASGAFDTPALKPSCFTVPLLNPGDLGGAIPPGDSFETNFSSGQRNIFRQSLQRRVDLSLVKITKMSERVSVKYALDAFNLTNTSSFDIPINSITQNVYYNDFPTIGTQPLPSSCSNLSNVGFYSCPAGLGAVNKTIGSPRQVQMSLEVSF